MSDKYQPPDSEVREPAVSEPSPGGIEVTYRGLAPSDRRALVWGFAWRGFVIGVGAMVSGAIAGGLIGFVWGASVAAIGGDVQAHLPAIQVVGFIAGLVLGVCFLILFLRWLLSVRFGRIRLALLRTDG